MAKTQLVKALTAPKKQRRLIPPAVLKQRGISFQRPWVVESYHESAVTPGAYKLHTPYGAILAIVDYSGMGTLSPEARLYFELTQGNVRYAGRVWVEMTDGTVLAPRPDTSVAKMLIKRLLREFPQINGARKHGPTARQQRNSYQPRTILW